jgi:hypothetical protein
LERIARGEDCLARRRGLPQESDAREAGAFVDTPAMTRHVDGVVVLRRHLVQKAIDGRLALQA